MRAPTAHGATRRSCWPTAGPAARRICGSATRSRDRAATARTGATSSTEVLDHWTTIKPRTGRHARGRHASCSTSGDHRFLTERGWKHVIEHRAVRAGPAAPHDEQLAARHRRASPTRRADDADYRRGYLCGLIRGDGHLGSLRRTRVSDRVRVPARADRFRGTAPRAALPRRARGRRRTNGFSPPPRRARARDALRCGRGCPRDRSRRSASSSAGRARPNHAVAQGLPRRHLRRRGLVQRRARSASPTRTATIIHWTRRSRSTGSGSTPSSRPTATERLRRVRIRGGLKERLRFFHLTRPGDHAQADDRRHGAEVRRADARRRRSSRSAWSCRSTTSRPAPATSSPNGVVSHNCFARPTHEYLDFNAGRDFEKEIVVKVNVPEVLRAELARPSWGRRARRAWARTPTRTSGSRAATS